MHTLIAIIGAGERSTHALLAAEALRSAAQRLGWKLEAEVRTSGGVVRPLVASSDAQQLLLVGTGELDAERYALLPRLHVALDAVLADAEGVLKSMTAALAPVSPATVNIDVAKPQRIVAITSCPTGIAHTFMAAEGIQQAGKALGFAVRVETQGSVGARDTLTDSEIRDADVVLIAADTQVELTRFAGKRVYRSATKPAITDGQALLRRALAEAELQGARLVPPARQRRARRHAAALTNT